MSDMSDSAQNVRFAPPTDKMVQFQTLCAAVRRISQNALTSDEMSDLRRTSPTKLLAICDSICDDQCMINHLARSIRLTMRTSLALAFLSYLPDLESPDDLELLNDPDTFHFLDNALNDLHECISERAFDLFAPNSLIDPESPELHRFPDLDLNHMNMTKTAESLISATYDECDDFLDRLHSLILSDLL